MVAVAVELCRLRRLALERQERDLERLPALGYTWDPDEGTRVVTFFESYLHHHKGEWAGQRLIPEPWQKGEILIPLFSWFRPDGTRRFRVAWIELPRKNTKSTMGAGIGLYLMGPDGEAGAEVFCAATKEKQAKIVHDTAKEMVKASPELRGEFRALRSNIHCMATGSKFEPLGSDSDRLDGLNTHGLIIDEAHAIKDRHLVDVLTTSMGSRRQPLTVIITTAGVWDPESYGWQMHNDAVQVLEGVIEDDEMFAYICTADEGDDPYAKDTWRKANPNYGISIKESYLEGEARKAKRSPSYLNTFLRYHLNIWVQQEKRWISPDAWNACPSEPFDLEDMAGRRCFVGVDLSSKIDITSACFVFPPDGDDEPWSFVWRFWVPQDLIADRAARGVRPDYGAWVRDGWMTATPGNVVDYEFIRTEIQAASQVVHIQEVGFDPWNATQFAQEMEKDGFAMVEVRQGPRSLSEPSKLFEALVVSKQLRHGGNPVARWMVANVAVRKDANENIAPDKSKAAGKIDGVVAAIMGISRGSLVEMTGWVPI